MRLTYIGLVIMCVAAFTMRGSAHHSHNAYEVTVWSNLEGIVKEIHFSRIVARSTTQFIVNIKLMSIAPCTSAGPLSQQPPIVDTHGSC